MKTLVEFKREAVEAACSHEGIRQLLVEGGHFEVLDCFQGIEIRLAVYRGETWYKSFIQLYYDSYEKQAFRELFWNPGIDAALRKLSEVSGRPSLTR